MASGPACELQRWRRTDPGPGKRKVAVAAESPAGAAQRGAPHCLFFRDLEQGMEQSGPQVLFAYAVAYVTHIGITSTHPLGTPPLKEIAGK